MKSLKNSNINPENLENLALIIPRDSRLAQSREIRDPVTRLESLVKPAKNSELESKRSIKRSCGFVRTVSGINALSSHLSVQFSSFFSGDLCKKLVCLGS